MQVDPIVYDGVMYIRHANERYSAHDATTGDIIWEYSRALPEEITGGEAVFTVHRGRGVFLFEDRLIGHSTDGMLFAVDPRTGLLVWETEMVDYHAGQQPSSAPDASVAENVLGDFRHRDVVAALADHDTQLALEDHPAVVGFRTDDRAARGEDTGGGLVEVEGLRGPVQPVFRRHRTEANGMDSDVGLGPSNMSPE